MRAPDPVRSGVAAQGRTHAPRHPIIGSPRPGHQEIDSLCDGTRTRLSGARLDSDPGAATIWPGADGDVRSAKPQRSGHAQAGQSIKDVGELAYA